MSDCDCADDWACHLAHRPPEFHLPSAVARERELTGEIAKLKAERNELRRALRACVAHLADAAEHEPGENDAAVAAFKAVLRRPLPKRRGGKR